MERNDLFVAAMVRRVRYSYPRVVNQDVGREISSRSFLFSYFYLPTCSRERHNIRQCDDNENETPNLFSRTGNLRKYSTSNVIHYGCLLIHALKSIKFAYSRVEIYQVEATRRIGDISFWNPLANSVYECI